MTWTALNTHPTARHPIALRSTSIALHHASAAFVFQILKHATTFFSRATPNLAQVIPSMDFINERFTIESFDRSYDLAIHSALKVAKKTMDRYYQKTHQSDVYRIAMVLHPRHKLVYFRRQAWPEEWITEAKDLVRTQFSRKYASRPAGGIHEAVDNGSEPVHQSENIFDSLAALAPPKPTEMRDELDRYLSTDVEQTENVIQWWTERRAMYPRLSRMALDYLTIPATAVDVERVFSQGRLLISHVRSRLSAQTTRALLCLGRWSRMDLKIIKHDDVLKVVALPEVPEEDGDSDGEIEMPEGWDRIDE